ncbi:DedA family protein [Peribacillus sp. SCS-37]|uniref:DedA family protein n=1 Tax=Paraperibacillus esterisolvens TaxID=3115296 RepID=UPI0039058759
MNIETISHYIDVYGYFIIFLFLFFGIVGIPAPEESLLFLIGVLVLHNQLSFGTAIISAMLGSFMGMISAYFCGRYLGNPFINKYGKYLGITKERVEAVKRKYSINIHKTILFGFYMPGIRQINPYFAGVINISFQTYVLLSFLGSLLWTVPFVLSGYYFSRVFHVNASYVPYVGLLFLAILLIRVITKHIRKRM